nr:MAG: hypothetical protein [Caudoviricetes sp.]
MEEVLKNLLDWQEYVSIPREELNGFAICPFAKTEKLEYEIVESEQKLLIQILKREKTNKEMFIFVDKNKTLTSEITENLINFYNEISSEYSYFIDDYNNPNYINGINAGNGNYIIIIAQRNDVLESVRKKLIKTNYYSMIEPEYLKKIGVNLNEC